MTFRKYAGKKLAADNRGQTSLEYLMLLALTFISAYILARGPVASFTQGIFQGIFFGLQNVITYAEWTNQPLQEGRGAHPTNPGRLRPLHL